MHARLEDIGLLAVLGVVLVAPFTNKRVESNLELFLFVMGTLAATIAWVWDGSLVVDALSEPILKGIVPAVLAAGLLFSYGQKHVAGAMAAILRRVPLKVVLFALVVLLGFLSSVITAIIASLLLVEVLVVLPLERRDQVRIAVVACFAIGLGAALLPIGEPLSTIAVSKLQGEPYHAGFSFLFRELALYILPGVFAFGVIGLLVVARGKGAAVASQADTPLLKEPSRFKEVVGRTLKVYLFVMALILLGAGFEVLIDRYLTHVSAQLLFWLNITSSILDNATLTAAEISPTLGIEQIRGALVALLVAGGILIPGNIPNIISAHRLGITSREWAKLGVPLGLAAMVIYFLWLYYLP